MLCCQAGAGPSRDGIRMPTEWSNGESASDERPVGPTDRDALLRELEDELCRLAGVHAVRVVGDRSGRPVEVHVLGPQQAPKQTVRDVRSVAHTVFGIEIDHRIVSVAQLDTNEADTPVGIVLPTADACAADGCARRQRRPTRRCAPRWSTSTATSSASRRDRSQRSPARCSSPATLDAPASSSPQPTPCTSGERGDRPDREQPRRGRHRGLRRATDGAVRIGFGHRAASATRPSSGGARRHESADQPHGARPRDTLSRDHVAIRANLPA